MTDEFRAHGACHRSPARRRLRQLYLLWVALRVLSTSLGDPTSSSSVPMVPTTSPISTIVSTRSLSENSTFVDVSPGRAQKYWITDANPKVS